MSDKVYLVNTEGGACPDYDIDLSSVLVFSRKSLARKYVNFHLRKHGYSPDIFAVTLDQPWEDNARHRFFTVGLNWNPSEFAPEQQRERPPRDLDTIVVWFRGEERDPWSYREQYDGGFAAREGYIHDGQVSFMQRPAARNQRPMFSITASSKVSYEEAKRLIYEAWEDRFYDEVMKSYDMYDARRQTA